jgi:exosortase/archaeosortase family protein
VSPAAALADERRDQRRFVYKFSTIAAGLLLLYCFPYEENGVSELGFDSFLAAYARLANVAIRLFDPSAVVIGKEIHGRFAVGIIKGCDAMEAKLLFLSAVLAFPGRWGRKLLVAFGGLGLLVLLNVARITTLYIAGALKPSLVETLHYETWPFITITVAGLLFLAGTSYLRAADAEPPTE